MARSRCYQTLPIDHEVKGTTPGTDGRQMGKSVVRFSRGSVGYGTG